MTTLKKSNEKSLNTVQRPKKVASTQTIFSVLSVGDIHFHSDRIEEGRLFTLKLVELVRDRKPDLVVLLGDILDHHGRGNLSEVDLLDQLLTLLGSEVDGYGRVIALVGNHDAQPAPLFPESNWIRMFRHFPNVTVVDRAMIFEKRGFRFTFCPYVPPGRLADALDLAIFIGDGSDLRLLTGESIPGDANFKTTACVFLHQEMQGCHYGPDSSTVGDPWDSEYPPILSGHIHEHEIVDPNIFYIGSSIQANFSESTDKTVWLTKFGGPVENRRSADSENSTKNLLNFTERIDLGLPKKVEVRMNFDEIEAFDIDDYENSIVRLRILARAEEYRKFLNSKQHHRLTAKGVTFSHDLIHSELDVPAIVTEVLGEDDPEEDEKSTSESFVEIVRKLAVKRGSNVQVAFKEVFGVEVLNEES